MMLWDIIRDWFVQYIFGGISSSGEYYNTVIGNVTTYVNGEWDDAFIANGNDINLAITKFANTELTLTMADWLSTTATIITLVLLIIMLLALVRFVIRQVCGLFAKI